MLLRLIATVVVLLAPQWGLSQDANPAQGSKRVVAQAPPNHSVISNTWGGAYFAPNDLERKFSKLRRRAEELQALADHEGFDSRVMLLELEKVSTELAEVKARVEKEQVFVPILPVFEQTDTYDFAVEDERRVLVVADKIHIESWDGPSIRCTLKKQILAKSQPPASEFAKLFVEHSVRILTPYVGETVEEHNTNIAAVLKTPEGMEIAKRREAEGLPPITSEGYTPPARYHAYQGKRSHLLKVQGAGSQSDQLHFIEYEIQSAGIPRTVGSTEDRRSELTIQFPRKISAAVSGCSGGVTVSQFEGDLTLSNNGPSQTRLPNTISGVTGHLAVYGLSLASITNIRGSVLLDMSVDEWPNSGASSDINGFRRYGTDLSHTTTIRGIAENLTTKFVHGRLNISEIGGVIDVQNEFGPTQLQLNEQTNLVGTHRVVSESGPIRVTAPKALLSQMKWYLCTTVGELRTNADRDLLDDVGIRSGDRGWRVLFTPKPNRKVLYSSAFPEDYEQPQRIMKNTQRSPGFNLLSRAGRVTLELQ